MIEINLHPGAPQRRSRRLSGGGLKLPSFGALPQLDRGNALMVGGWIVSLGLLAWLFLGIQTQKRQLNVAIEEAVQDSTRYAATIAAQEKLLARRDTIAQKLDIIQDVDAGRFVWPHLLDEVSRAVPQHTWLTSVAQTDVERSRSRGARRPAPARSGGNNAAVAMVEVEDGIGPRFEIKGRTGNTFALTRFMKDLEASPFVRNVHLASTELVQENDHVFHSFVLQANYEEPSDDLIETTPLFAADANVLTAE